MKCPYCDGKGYYYQESSYGMELVQCNCQNKMTNEEYLKSCNTEQLAEVLGKIAKNAYQCGQNGKTNKCVNRKHCTGYCDYGWEMWLKQPHKPFS